MGIETEYAARIVHAAVMALRMPTGDEEPPKAWDEIAEETRAVYRTGVEFHKSMPNVTAEEGHLNWMEIMKKIGREDHPEFLPYNELDDRQRAERMVFAAVVEACKIVPEPVPIVQQVAAQPPKQMNMVAVEYIGNRDRYTEGLTSSKYMFTKEGKDKIVFMPEAKAAILLQHTGVFKRAAMPAEEAPAEDVQKAIDEEKEEETSKAQEETAEDMKVAVKQMDMDGLKAFAFKNFSGYKPPGNIKEDTLRNKINTMIDQLGVE